EQGTIPPAKILAALHKEMATTLHQENYTQITNEGMDIAICLYNTKSRKLVFAGAKRPFYYYQDNKLKVIKGSTQSIGGNLYRNDRTFEEHEINLEKDDSFYLFTDGITDQFGGPDDKKFLSWRLKHQLNLMQPHGMTSQLHHLENAILDWRGSNEQTDDMLMVGVKV
ncbi:MAG: serine/threonine-protein phosphatase, partial [Saprospiraceae bacterium]|nr:serine/threonine-protein phosphatase [Saprospiraceae bacterium]